MRDSRTIRQRRASGKGLLFLAILITVIPLSLPHRAVAAEAPPPAADLSTMNLSELMDVTITSLSKKPESSNKAAAAVYVISREDIRRTGATSIPDLLRMVPGVQVGRENTTSWAVGVRGLYSGQTNNLLVLMDGRSVYNPVFSGANWSIIDLNFDDIERVEVIRGSGGAIWGSNAMNGVINIITRNAGDTQGGHLSVGTGTVDHAIVGLRYGSELRKSVYSRVWTKYSNRDGLAQSNDPSDIEWDAPGNDWRSGRGGFRIDATPNDTDTFSLQGTVFRQLLDVQYREPLNRAPYVARSVEVEGSAGANLLGRWEHTYSSTSTGYVQIYHDYTDTDRLSVNATVNTTDLEIGHYFEWGERHSFNMGAGARLNAFNFNNTMQMAVEDPSVRQTITNVFLQDEIKWFDGRLRTTFGLRVDDNSFGNVEVLPDFRVAWSATERAMLWASISRSVRSPSLIEKNFSWYQVPITSDDSPPIYPVSRVQDDFDTEKLIAREVGLRMQPTQRLTADVSFFHNEYEDLASIEREPAVMKEFLGKEALLHIEVPFQLDNHVHGDSWGLEIHSRWKVTEWWKLEAGFTATEFEFLDRDLNSSKARVRFLSGSTPEFQSSLRSSFTLPRQVELDLWLRFVDKIKYFGYEDYTTLDMRIGWQATEQLTLSLTGTNLLDPRHKEWSNFEVKRAAYFKIDYGF